jgi:AcrR family transcriptional regulator
MARIAEEVGCSRPAVYQYFRNKEEVVVALAVDSATLRNRLHARVPSFAARPRERLVALAEVDAILHPEWPVLDETICANALRVHAASERQEALRRAQREAWEVHLQCVRDGVRARDLALPRGLSDEQLVLTLTTFSIGLFGRLSRGIPHLEDDRSDPRSAMHRVGSAFLDGLDWHPLSSEWDYRETMRRIYTEVYPAEVLRELGIPASRSFHQSGRVASIGRRSRPGASS